MTSIGFDIPEDITAIRNAIEAFVRTEVIASHERIDNLFSDPRRLYRKDGRICDEALDRMREVRMASVKLGYFNMCVPEEIGGAGMGRRYRHPYPGKP